MDNYGLLPKFKLNRPLKKEEKKHQLHQKEPILWNGNHITPNPDHRVITMNSHYLEMVDKYYNGKGWGALMGLAFFPTIALITLGIIYTIITHGNIKYPSTIFILFVALILSVTFNYYMLKILKAELFSWTHYPIRFDRKNQLVHYFRTNGTVNTAPWEKIFFTSGLSYHKTRFQDYYISGHVLAEDNETVLDTFCLPSTISDREMLESQWEFVRRYMEEGPESVASTVKFCLPIAEKRENYNLGILNLLPGSVSLPIYFILPLLPFLLIISIPRYIAIQTSKIPVWPEEIDALHKPESDDPYHIDASINSKHPWRDMLRWTIEKR